jgi:hypothetical protein
MHVHAILGSMNQEVTLAVSMVVNGETKVKYTVDDLNEDATFTFVGAQGFESYLMLDTDALQRFHEMTGVALDELRTERPEP